MVLWPCRYTDMCVQGIQEWIEYAAVWGSGLWVSTGEVRLPILTTCILPVRRSSCNRLQQAFSNHRLPSLGLKSQDDQKMSRCGF